MVVHCSFLTSEENLKIPTEDMQLTATYKVITEIQKQFKPLKYDRLKYAMMNNLQ